MAIAKQLEKLVATSEEYERQGCEKDIREMRCRLENMRILLDTMTGDLLQPTRCFVHALGGSTDIGSELAWRFGRDNIRTVFVFCFRRDNKVRFVVNTIERYDINDESWRVFSAEYLFGNESVYTTVADVVRQQIGETKKWLEETHEDEEDEPNEPVAQEAHDMKESIIQKLEASKARSEQWRHIICAEHIARVHRNADIMKQLLEMPGTGPTKCTTEGWKLKPQLVWESDSHKSRKVLLTCDRLDTREAVLFTVTTEDSCGGMFNDETVELFTKTFELSDAAEYPAVWDCVQQQVAAHL